MKALSGSLRSPSLTFKPCKAAAKTTRSEFCPRNTEIFWWTFTILGLKSESSPRIQSKNDPLIVKCFRSFLDKTKKFQSKSASRDSQGFRLILGQNSLIGGYVVVPPMRSKFFSTYNLLHGKLSQHAQKSLNSQNLNFLKLYKNAKR